MRQGGGKKGHKMGNLKSKKKGWGLSKAADPGQEKR